MSEQREYCLQMEVRDYECDYQDVVNNAVYQNYLEHARHMAVKEHFSVPKLSQQGINLVVSEVQLRYLRPLRSGSRFVVRSRFALKGQFRLVFEQCIVKIPETSEGDGEDAGQGSQGSQGEKILQAKVCVAALDSHRGRPCPFSRVTELCGYEFR